MPTAMSKGQRIIADLAASDNRRMSVSKIAIGQWPDSPSAQGAPVEGGGADCGGTKDS